MTETAFWTRCDSSGHDAARVDVGRQGMRLWGNAAFLQNGAAAGLAYVVDMAPDGTAQSGRVRGFVGGATIDLTLQRIDGDWLMNGRPQGLKGLLDLDYGFTPATNWQQLRRLSLDIGEQAEIEVAWLDVDTVGMERLPQIYRRLDARTYAYEAPTFGYAATLTLAPSGFVADYPSLWRMEPTSPGARTG